MCHQLRPISKNTINPKIHGCEAFASLEGESLFSVTIIDTMNLSTALIEAKNIIESAEHLVGVWEKDPDDYSAIKQALTELRDELNRVEEE